MKKIGTIMISLFVTGSLFAQPDQWFVTIDPAQEAALLKNKRQVDVVKTSTPIVVDGVADAAWSSVEKCVLDRNIIKKTIYSGGKYKDTSLLGSQPTAFGIPEKYSPRPEIKFLYDADYIYGIVTVYDAEINDGVTNPGINEVIELYVSPYPDSLMTKNYPPYTGTAGALSKKYAYWGYHGAFNIKAMLIENNNCNLTIRQKADAMAKINYDQRMACCPFAWKKGTYWYTLEFAISRSITMADSAGNAFQLPADDQIKQIGFDIIVNDFSTNKQVVKYSWNSDNSNVWDALLYAGKMNLRGNNIVCGAPLGTPVCNDTSICNNSSVKLTATGGSDYRWYNANGGSTIEGTGAQFTTPVLEDTTIYRVKMFNGKCDGSTYEEVWVTLKSKNASFEGYIPANICPNASPIDLTGTTLPAGGTFSGIGVSANKFNPKNLQPGFYTIKYGYTDVTTTCSDTATKTIQVDTLPDIQVTGLDSSYVVTSSGFKLVATPAGGTFTGLGVVDGFYYPQLAGTGTHQLIYEASKGGCSNKDTFMIKVVPVGFAPEQDVLLYIYPNPSSGKFTVGANQGVALIQIISETGTVIAEELATGNNDNKHYFDLSGQAPGMYIVKVVSDGKTAIGKIMVR